MMNIYPENDWRNYLEHSFRSHKYISRKRGKNGKWIYIYKKTSNGLTTTTKSFSTEPDGYVDFEEKKVHRKKKKSKVNDLLSKLFPTTKSFSTEPDGYVDFEKKKVYRKNK